MTQKVAEKFISYLDAVVAAMWLRTRVKFHADSKNHIESEHKSTSGSTRLNSRRKSAIFDLSVIPAISRYNLRMNFHSESSLCTI